MNKFTSAAESVFRTVFNTLLPDLCPVCGRRLLKGEHTMCLHCRLSLPAINNQPFNNNAVHRHLAATTPIEHAAAMFIYRRGDRYVKLIHTTKYYSRPRLGRRLGYEFALQLKSSGFFTDIDAIVPVPLHWWKHIRRGYNQSEEIARGVSAASKLPVLYDMLSARRHSSQTRYSRTSRWLNAESVYYAAHRLPDSIGHVLIVDDVITTGATMLACCRALHQTHPYLRISVLSLSMTSQI